MSGIKVISLNEYLKLDDTARRTVLENLRQNLIAESDALENSDDVDRSRAYSLACKSYLTLCSHTGDPIQC